MNVEYRTLADWEYPSVLEDQTVEVWTVRLDTVADTSGWIPCLIREEQNRANRLKMERVRSQFVIGRSILRHLLGRYLELDPLQVPLDYEPSGKPILKSPHDGVYFNVSHSEQIGVFAFCRSVIGVDVEKAKPIPNMELLVERFFSEREKQAFRDLAEADRFEAFFQAWTRKEAVLKAVGRGIQSLNLCDVTFGPNQPAQLLRLAEDHNTIQHWFLQDWSPDIDFHATIAVCSKR